MSITVRMTLAISQDILNAVDQAVTRGQARSRSEFVANSLRHEIERITNAAIDAGFAAMAKDVDYQAEARQIADEFASADCEALQLAEDEQATRMASG